MSGGLPFWIERMLSYNQSDTTKEPGKLVKQFGSEYLYPIIPPGYQSTFLITPSNEKYAKGIQAYALIFYRLRFGYIQSGAFNLTLIPGGSKEYDGTISGYQLENGIDYLFFCTTDTTINWSLTNLTPNNQFFEMTSQYLIVSTKTDWELLKQKLYQEGFPYPIPQ